jgi:hypothetical protein
MRSMAVDLARILIFMMELRAQPRLSKLESD